MSNPKGSILMAIFWMIVISLLLFWLPGLGPLIAGIVGGKVAGGVLRGLTAVFVPALLLDFADQVDREVVTPAGPRLEPQSPAAQPEPESAG